MNRYGPGYFQAVDRFAQAAGALHLTQQEHDEAPDWVRPVLAEDLKKARVAYHQTITTLVNVEQTV